MEEVDDLVDLDYVEVVLGDLPQAGGAAGGGGAETGDGGLHDDDEEDKEDVALTAAPPACVTAALEALEHRAPVGNLLPKLLEAKEQLAEFLFLLPPPSKRATVSLGRSCVDQAPELICSWIHFRGTGAAGSGGSEGAGGHLAAGPGLRAGGAHGEEQAARDPRGAHGAGRCHRPSLSPCVLCLPGLYF
jgi:hypothetical protein